LKPFGLQQAKSVYNNINDKTNAGMAYCETVSL